jgi:hypothetical protein
MHAIIYTYKSLVEKYEEKDWIHVATVMLFWVVTPCGLAGR